MQEWINSQISYWEPILRIIADENLQIIADVILRIIADM